MSLTYEGPMVVSFRDDGPWRIETDWWTLLVDHVSIDVPVVSDGNKLNVVGKLTMDEGVAMIGRMEIRVQVTSQDPNAFLDQISRLLKEQTEKSRNADLSSLGQSISKEHVTKLAPATSPFLVCKNESCANPMAGFIKVSVGKVMCSSCSRVFNG